MNDWHNFLGTYFKDKKATDPNYLYRQAMKDAKIPYSKFKIHREKIRKEVGKKLHLVRAPLNYIMAEYLNTHDKISLKLSSDFFTNVKLNNKDCKLLYCENKQKIKDEKKKKRMWRLNNARLPAVRLNNARLPRGLRLNRARLRQLLMMVD